MPDLSILIPARNEMFLGRTVQDILAHAKGDTEVIVVLDGEPGAISEYPIPLGDRVHGIVLAESIGQRAATNLAARQSSAKYIMKVDAHCAFDEGFDLKLMAEFEPDWTVIPRMYNLHVFDWVCQICGERKYQGPKPVECAKCTSQKFEMDVVWQPRWSRRSDFARFDTDLHFQYWGSYGKRPEAQGEIADLMSHVGACWMMERERYWELGGCDEAHGSWGQMGTEISCKTWLSGGRQVVNKRTWFSHLFRTQPGFSFPYPMSGEAQEAARVYSRKLWLENAWPGQIRPLAWLIEKFAPVPGWHEPEGEEKLRTVREAAARFGPARVTPVQDNASAPSAPSIGVVYYTDNRLDSRIQKAVQAQLQRSLNGHELVSVSLEPMDFGCNIVLPLERGVLTMFKQILAGLEACTAEVVFFAEHDVLYHPSHFEFRPPRHDAYYYNQANWKVDLETGHCLFYWCHQTLALVAYRELLLEHYRARVERVEREGKFDRAIGFEPGDHRRPRGIDDHPSLSFMSAVPNIDLRHGKNLTSSRWRQDQFRNQKYCQGWQEADEVPGWGRMAGRVQEVLDGLSTGQGGDKL